MKHPTYPVALAILAVLAFAATAQATRVTTTTGGGASTPTIHAVNEGGHSRILTPLSNIECSSTIEGGISSHGSGVTASGNVSTLLFNNCTNGWHVTAITNGSLEIHWTSGHNGTLTSSGAKVDTTRFGITCVYDTKNTSIGTVTGGNPATIVIEASLVVNETESNLLCGSGGFKWEGSYVTTSALYVTS